MYQGMNEDGVSGSGKPDGWRKSKVWEGIQGSGAGQVKGCEIARGPNLTQRYAQLSLQSKKPDVLHQIPAFPLLLKENGGPASHLTCVHSQWNRGSL